MVVLTGYDSHDLVILCAERAPPQSMTRTAMLVMLHPSPRLGSVLGRCALMWSLFLLLGGNARSNPTGFVLPWVEDEAQEIRSAANRGVELLQSSAAFWTREIPCFSCHHQGIGGLTIRLAAEAGLDVDLEAAARETEAVYDSEVDRFEPLLVGDGVGVFGRSTILLALGTNGRPRDSLTDAVAGFLAARQTASGAWYSNEHRPPFEDSHVTATALTVRALALYGPEGREQEIRGRIDRARDWLRATRPKDNEEMTMRMLGLAWCGDQGDALKADTTELLSKQRADGGWAQLPTMASDAYATGQALVVLHQAGALSPTHAAYKKGVRFLLDCQLPDGSWRVRTRRRIKGMPQIKTGFPHGRHQFVSYLATCWATMGLGLAGLEPQPTHAFFGPPPLRGAEDPVAIKHGFSPLHRAAAFGSFDELERLLAQGLDVDRKGPRGMTALMLAAHDKRKVDLLLCYGGDPRVETEWCFSPLLSASLTQGAGAVVRELLKYQPNVNSYAVNGASALMGAATLGDVDTLEALAGAGAVFPPGQLTLALNYAATCNDVAVGRALLGLGANINAGIGRHPACLISATISGYEPFVQFAIEAGADLEVRDKTGMSALAWAAKIDPGHGRLVRRLLAAGANPLAENEDGQTPMQLAKRYRNKAALRQLGWASEVPTPAAGDEADSLKQQDE